MSGGKGGSQTQTTEMAIPPYLEEPIKRNIARAEEISRIGYVPYYGPEVAAMTPMQEAAIQSSGMAAQAYGLPNALGYEITPEPQTFAGGVRGYSSGSLYDQALAELQARRPGQYDAIMNQFLDPLTGRPATGGAEEQDPRAAQEQMFKDMGYTPVRLNPLEARNQSRPVFKDEFGRDIAYLSPFEAQQRRSERQGR